MIQYYKGAFNFNLLCRFSGSSAYRGMLAGLVSLSFYFFYTFGNHELFTESGDPFYHPNAVLVLISAVSLIIVFKVNNSYSRHWEAYGRVFEMMGRFQDATQHMVAYHMQCDHFDAMRPPSYYDFFELNNMNLTRDRERALSVKQRDFSQRVVSARAIRKSINYVRDEKKQELSNEWDEFEDANELDQEDSYPKYLQAKPRLDGGWGKLFNDRKTDFPTATYYNFSKPNEISREGFAGTQGGRTPDLLLQEMMHLTSLLSAVALSTLRNDVDDAESPLDMYRFGEEWPEVDSTKIKSIKLSAWDRVRRIVGADLSPEERTKYNAARPLGVIGGVSEAEIRMLQMARGPYAKTQLAFNWVSEFFVRESLSGSVGKVESPLISRSMQFLSNGMVHYNHARKIMCIPFPFPHAQISVLYMLVIVPSVPLMLSQYTSAIWLGAMLSFLAVSCLCGLEEVSRELENPFRKPPNEIPICTLQAQFNEALIIAYSGYHPDAYFEDFLPRQSPEAHDCPTLADDEFSDDTELNEIQSNIEMHCNETQRLRSLLEVKLRRRKILPQSG